MISLSVLGNALRYDFPSRSQAQKAKHPAISAGAVPAK